ncbi:MAG: pentapeptide repeat-containing protein [Elainellaceae cyanobacterium]
MDFSEANLRGANLAGTDLTGANLTGANLTGAILIGATLDQANLTDAILRNVIAQHAHVKGTLFSQTNCRGGQFGGVKFTQAQLKDVDFRNADLLSAVILPEQMLVCRFNNTLMPDGEIFFSS